MKKNILLTLIVVALLCVAGWTGYGQRSTQSRVTYEYQIIFDPTETGGLDDGIKKLNELGFTGWELVGIKGASRGPGTMLYLRRPRN